MSEPRMGDPAADASAAWRPRLAPRARLRWDEVEKRYMLVFPEAALMLNETAPEILKLCDGEHTIEGIVDSLVQRFAGIERKTIEEDVTSFVARIRARGLLEG
ncbi:MAG: pyrroloquinoline quinone biosynthesis peptide chaperone PqqD [candidate division NC10 bacterium]|nr:pyrroloquinoline quinone biosynthesis peptide chaperone PqqD [candidate division NC10 bacterium]